MGDVLRYAVETLRITQYSLVHVVYTTNLMYPTKHGRSMIEVVDTLDHLPHPRLVGDGKMATSEIIMSGA